MKRRRLSDDDVALWKKVAQSAERLHPAAATPLTAMPKPKSELPAVVREPLVAFVVGAKAQTRLPAHNLMPGMSDRMATQPVQMDKKAFGRLKRGKLMPEGKIDLHGMTADQAHGALNGFILREHGAGKRLVLVITGKGKSKEDYGPIPTRRGVLKHQVPQWLSLAPLNSCVMQVAEAHLRHGGSGAYYVYLRRR